MRYRIAILTVLMSLLSLSLFSMPAAAQDEAIPSVDEVDTPPVERLVTLTLGLYDAVIANKGGECPSFAPVVRAYLDEHADAIEQAAIELATATETMTDEEKAEVAAYVRTHLSGDRRTAKAQKILYPCLRSRDSQGYKYPLDKQMDRLYRLQRPLMDAWVGNVD